MTASPVVYHGAPKGMVGEIIYPLNRLKAIDPAAYELQKSKYVGREAAMAFRIPGIEMLLNDVVHCAALNPQHLYAARLALGLKPPARPAEGWSGLFYAIPLDRILVHPVVWYSGKTLWINGAPNEDVALTPPLEEFEPFDPTRYGELAAPTALHLSYLESMRDRGQRPLMFVHIPHVFVAGPIDVSGLEPIGWDTAIV